jgi:tRNA nucleotidyltransferase (CCA-adding enzyme)
MVDSTPVGADPIPGDPESLSAALGALEGLDEIRRRLEGRPAWLVGGAVRDLLLGARRADVDLAVEGDAEAVAAALGGSPRTHVRFGTASVVLPGNRRVDVARTRRESYPRPGALPEVGPASLAEDLARRDFTVNAMAIPLHGTPELIDPHGGRDDLERGVLRVLHPRSFEDDPTRALRAARYSARLGFEVEPETLELLRAADLAAVSKDRIDAELRRLLSEDAAPEAALRLHRWGLAGVDADASERLGAGFALLADGDWAAAVDRPAALRQALLPSEDARRAASLLAGPRPARPSKGIEAVRGVPPDHLFVARIAGADWLDDWARHWRKVRLEIAGEDLLEAGVPQGPAVGRGLEAALAAKIDGEISTRDEELRVALAAAAVT